MDSIDNNIAKIILNYCDDHKDKINLILTNKLFNQNLNSIDILEYYLKKHHDFIFYNDYIKYNYFEKIIYEFNNFIKYQENYEYKNIFSSNKANQAQILRFLSQEVFSSNKYNDYNFYIFLQIILLTYILELRKKVNSVIYLNMKLHNNIINFCSYHLKYHPIILNLLNKIKETLPK